MKKINVLSLFDGISCGRVALKQAGIEVDNYFASEIDKYAMTVSKANNPEIIQIGDVTKVETKNGKLIINNKAYKIDLLIGGFPCQAFSFAGKQGNFDDARGKLFFECVRLLKDLNPKYFMFENVKMKKEFEEFISSQIGVKPILMNSNTLSAQNRQRLYWTNIPNIKQPKDKSLFWDSVQINNAANVYYVTPKMEHWIHKDEERTKKFKVYKNTEKIKMQMLEASHSKGISNQRCFSVDDSAGLRFIHPVECELLQNLPFNQTELTLEIDSIQAKSILNIIKKNASLNNIITNITKEQLKEFSTVVNKSNKDFTAILEGRTILDGADTLQKMEQNSKCQKNEKISLKVNLTDCASLEEFRTQLESMASLSKATLSHLSLKNIEAILICSYLFAKSKLEDDKKGLNKEKNSLTITLIDGYTNHVSNTQRYKAIGNGWTANVITHIFKNIK